MRFAPRGVACVLVTCLLLPANPVVAEPAPFPDMANSWYQYQQAVTELSRKGVISGYPDGTFKPGNTINRAEFLKIVFQGKSDSKPVTRRCFFDVSPKEWYAPYVCAAKSRRIVSGYSSGAFKPENPVTFAEAIKILLSAYGHTVEETKGKDWFTPYTKKLEDLGVLPAHSYVPWQPINRERAADLLWRMLELEQHRTLPRYSPGCNKSSPSQPLTTVTVRGVPRSFLLTVPSSYKVHDPSPLIVAFHGRTNSNEMVRKYMDLDKTMTDSFIAYPAALPASKGSFSWQDPGDKATSIRDVALFDAIVESVANQYCIDMDRLTVVGHSLGAWMANTVACVRGSVILASATVGGDSVQTTCSGPAAAMIMHNPKDNLAPFSGAEKVRTLRMSTNACTWESVPGPGDLNCIRYSHCATGNDVLWCPHTISTDWQGKWYPHTWPNSAAKRIQEFFRSLP